MYTKNMCYILILPFRSVDQHHIDYPSNNKNYMLDFFFFKSVSGIFKNHHRSTLILPFRNVDQHHRLSIKWIMCLIKKIKKGKKRVNDSYKKKKKPVHSVLFFHSAAHKIDK